jgi:hypothetical protein
MFEMNYDLLEYRSRFDIFTGKIHKPIPWLQKSKTRHITWRVTTCRLIPFSYIGVC